MTQQVVLAQCQGCKQGRCRAIKSVRLQVGWHLRKDRASSTTARPATTPSALARNVATACVLAGTLRSTQALLGALYCKFRLQQNQDGQVQEQVAHVLCVVTSPTSTESSSSAPSTHCTRATDSQDRRV